MYSLVSHNSDLEHFTHSVGQGRYIVTNRQSAKVGVFVLVFKEGIKGRSSWDQKGGGGSKENLRKGQGFQNKNKNT